MSFSMFPNRFYDNGPLVSFALLQIWIQKGETHGTEISTKWYAMLMWFMWIKRSAKLSLSGLLLGSQCDI